MVGILYWDVSFGNVMIIEESKWFKGFIIDFDYSSLIDSFVDGGIFLILDEFVVFFLRDVEFCERMVCILCVNMLI